MFNYIFMIYVRRINKGEVSSIRCMPRRLGTFHAYLQWPVGGHVIPLSSCTYK